MLTATPRDHITYLLSKISFGLKKESKALLKIPFGLANESEYCLKYLSVFCAKPADAYSEKLGLVAGAGFEPATFGL